MTTLPTYDAVLADFKREWAKACPPEETLPADLPVPKPMGEE